MKSFLFGVGAADPLTFVGASLVIVIVGLAASVIPARRATRIDPLIALRADT
jgi:ABC-type antimicrobial peptide transport system permease subunit